MTAATRSPDREEMRRSYGKEGELVYDGLQLFMSKRPARNWYPMVSNLYPMSQFRDVFDETYAPIKDSRLHLDNKTDIKTVLHLQWFEQDALRQWLHTKRDAQVEFLISATADVLLAANESNSITRTSRNSTAKHNLTKINGKINSVLDISAANNLNGLNRPVERIPVPLDPFLRPLIRKPTNLVSLEQH